MLTTKLFQVPKEKEKVEVQDLLFAQLQLQTFKKFFYKFKNFQNFKKLSKYKIKGTENDAADDTSSDWKARGKW